MDAYIAWSARIDSMADQKALHDDVEGLRHIAHAAEAGCQVWKSWVELAGGSMISSGIGDGRAQVPASKLSDLARLKEEYCSAIGSHAAVGVGMKLSEAERALRAAVLRGGDTIAFYSPAIDEELEKENSGPLASLEKAEDVGFVMVPTKEVKMLEPGRRMVKAQPVMNHGAGAGFGGSHPAAAAARPIPPKAEASEHSETEGLLGLLNDEDRPAPPEGTHAARDLEDHFHSLAQQQAVKDDQNRQVSERNLDKVKSQVVQALQAIRGQAQAMEQIKQSAPDLYGAITGVVQAMITLGREVAGSEQPVEKYEEDDAPDFEPLAKAAAPKLKPQVGPPPGFVDDFKHIKSHVQAHDPHSGMRSASTFGLRQINPDQYYWPKEPFPLDVNHEDLDMRDPASPQDVDQYTSKLQAGSEPPAIFGVYNPKGHFVSVLDGAHRLASKLAAGQPSIMAYIGLPKEMAHSGHWIEKAVAKTLGAVKPGKARPTRKDELEPKRELEPSEAPAGGQKLDKAKLPMPSPKGVSLPKVDLPIGTTLEGVGKVKVQHADGSTGWRQVRSGMITSQDPTHHPTSSREPNAK